MRGITPCRPRSIRILSRERACVFLWHQRRHRALKNSSRKNSSPGWNWCPRRLNGFLRTSNRGSHFVFRHRTVAKCCRIMPEYFRGLTSLNGALVIVQHGNSVKVLSFEGSGIAGKLAEIMNWKNRTLRKAPVA